MACADGPRQGDRDGRGNLSLKGLEILTKWFLGVCIDRSAMESLFDLKTLGPLSKRCIDWQEALPAGCVPLLYEALIRVEFDRAETPRITGLP